MNVSSTQIIDLSKENPGESKSSLLIKFRPFTNKKLSCLDRKLWLLKTTPNIFSEKYFLNNLAHETRPV